jgi:predicted amidophosphoribosyltransferase
MQVTRHGVNFVGGRQYRARMLFADSGWEVLGSFRCAGCGRRRGPLCSACSATLETPVDRQPPEGVDRIVCGWDYSGPARALVLGLKLRGERACAGPLAARLADRTRIQGITASALTWVPGRRGDIRRRGFDHARELARRMARIIGLEIVPLLERRLDRPDQVGLSAEARRSNLLGTFTCSTAAPVRIAVVDDLITTGATATSCAAALKRAGAARVELLAACSADRSPIRPPTHRPH